MASSKKKKKDVSATGVNVNSDDMALELVRDLNKEFGTRIAYNLAEATAPTIIKYWIKTGSILLDYAIANKKNGGYPGGRIIEVSGLPSTGKSHLAYEAIRSVQNRGGLVVYVDTENATPVEKLGDMGIDVKKRFVYVDTHCTEEVFSVIDSVIRKAKAFTEQKIPIFVVWDSVAGTSPKAELDGNYDQNTVGLQARSLSKGMRKITGLIGESGVTLMCINQLKQKIGAMFGDPYVTPGGSAIPYHASVRIRLTGEGTPLKDKAGNVIGIKVPLKIQKNKVGPPHRTFMLEIHFGKGIVETETLITTGIEYCDINGAIKRGDKLYHMGGKGKAWKSFTVTTLDGEIISEYKFHKPDFDNLLKDPKSGELLKEFYDSVLTIVFGDPEEEEEDINPTSDDEDMWENNENDKLEKNESSIKTS